MNKIGLVLSNIGTPKSPQPKDVGIYLDEFLMDPDVMPLPFLIRAALVKGLIVPIRSRSSGLKYQSIWTQKGSPLLSITQDFQQALQKKLNDKFIVKIGMRYGEPSLSQALTDLKNTGIKEILLAPMYPQFAEATVGSTIRRFHHLNQNFNFKFTVLKPFYQQKFFIESQLQVLEFNLDRKHFDYLLFSYHGLPLSQIKKNPICLKDNCCFQDNICLQNCYKAQCHKTSELLANALNLKPDQWSTSFQSRLGPAQWIGPSTLNELQRLVTSGKTTIAIACPSFVTDCLETLEEISLELKNKFYKAGGKNLILIPCLNDNQTWVDSFAKYLKENFQPI